jgi:AraC-like DNA-binding protein
MIITAEIPPLKILAPFVRCYSLREFDTKGEALTKPFHAPHEMSMLFFFKAKPVQLVDPRTHRVVNEGSYAGIMGLGTQYNGEMTFNGCYSIFEIVFKPCGLKIFNLSASEIIDRIVDLDVVFNFSIKFFYDKLCEATGLSAMADIANDFLVQNLKKQKNLDGLNGIAWISNSIVKNPCFIDMDKAAYDVNMSLRTFERRFTAQVGIPPKLFSCVARFNHAFSDKLKDPTKDWTSIALEHGYYDQNHLIKDFNRFAGTSPKVFLKQTPLAVERFSNRVEA